VIKSSGRRELVVRVLGGATGALLLLAGAGAYELTRSSGVAGARPHPALPLVSPGEFQRRTGVRLLSVALTGGGGLVDVRYQVIDPDAASSIHDPKAPPDLVDEHTGVVVNNLFMGHIHNGQLRAAQTYYLIFENPGSLLRPGTRVTVQLGTARVAHVPVR
jgi:hypothetical protein